MIWGLVLWVINVAHLEHAYEFNVAILCLLLTRRCGRLPGTVLVPSGIG